MKNRLLFCFDILLDDLGLLWNVKHARHDLACEAAEKFQLNFMLALYTFF